MNFTTVVVVILFMATAVIAYEAGRKYGETNSTDSRANLTQKQVMELERYDITLKYKLLQWERSREDPKHYRPDMERMGQEPKRAASSR